MPLLLFYCFCPCLKTFAKSLRMSDNVAGVTLLALGNGAPDIFSVLAAITTGNNNAAPLAFQELYGSGMFVTTIVVGSIQLRSSFKLARRPFLRDVVFYISAVAWTFVVMYKKEIQTAEAVGFIVLYVVYVTLVIAGQAVNRSMRSYVRLNDHIQDIPPPAINDEDNQPESQRLRIFTKSAIEDFPADADFTEFEHGRSLLLKHQHVPHDVPKNYGSTNQVIVSRVEESGNEDRQDFIEEPETFFERVIGINIEDWKAQALYWKIFDIIKIPLHVILNLTIPIVDIDVDGLRWNKWLVVIQCFTTPVACVFLTNRAFTVVHKSFVLWGLLLIIGAFCSVFVLLFTPRKRPPRYPVVFAIAGFIAAVIWIYAFAQEIVNLLTAFGISFGLSNAVLGLTLLAWGNSIGDFVANLAMAKNGAPRMAIAACYGGPLLSILCTNDLCPVVALTIQQDMMLGVGISCTVSSLTNNGHLDLIRGRTQYIISAAFLAVSLVAAVVVMPLLKFATSKFVGLFLILLYIGYLIMSIVNELHEIA
eukprot:gene14110-15585_t